MHRRGRRDKSERQRNVWYTALGFRMRSVCNENAVVDEQRVGNEEGDRQSVVDTNFSRRLICQARTTMISVEGLSYYHDPTLLPSLQDVSLHLPPGSRTLLVGANGGK